MKSAHILRVFFTSCIFFAFSIVLPAQTDSKPKTEKGLKGYLLGKNVIEFFPTELNIVYGYQFSILKYPSFDEFRNLYESLYNVNIPNFTSKASPTYGIGFRIASMGIELSKTAIHTETIASDFERDKYNNILGRRGFKLDADERKMALYIGFRKKFQGLGINIGGTFGAATLTPTYIDSLGNASASGQTYLEGIFKCKYSYVVLGPEYYIGYGRIKLTFRADFSLKKMKDDLFPAGIALKQDPADQGLYGPYIPKNMDGFKDPKTKSGVGGGQLLVGSDIRFNTLSVRLTYSIIYRSMPTNKKH